MVFNILKVRYDSQTTGMQDKMIKKVVHKAKLSEHDEIKQNREYWLSKTPEERVSAVEILRRQVYGNSARLQRVAKVIKRKLGM